MSKISFPKIIIPFIFLFHCFITYSQQYDRSGHRGFFYIENEADGRLIKYDIPQNPLDTTLNLVFWKLGVTHVNDIVKTVMVHDYIDIVVLTLYLKTNPKKSYWEAKIEYVYDLPLKKEKKNGRQYRWKQLGYNYIFIHAITGKVKRKKFKQTVIECY